jgi:transcription antitermination factor NusG
MGSDNENIFWYVLFASNGKVEKIRPYLEAACIEYFFPECYKERKIRNSERKKLTFEALLGNFLFVKSSREFLEPVLKEAKLRLGITSNLYYRDLGSKNIIVVPDNQMRNFIAVAGSKQAPIIYLSNAEVNLTKGTKVRITGGVFEGVEGFFMRIKGDRRVVVSIPNLFSVATAFIPTRFILSLE